MYKTITMTSLQRGRAQRLWQQSHTYQALQWIARDLFRTITDVKALISLQGIVIIMALVVVIILATKTKPFVSVLLVTGLVASTAIYA